MKNNSSILTGVIVILLIAAGLTFRFEDTAVDFLKYLMLFGCFAIIGAIVKFFKKKYPHAETKVPSPTPEIFKRLPPVLTHKFYVSEIIGDLFSWLWRQVCRFVSFITRSFSRRLICAFTIVWLMLAALYRWLDHHHYFYLSDWAIHVVPPIIFAAAVYLWKWVVAIKRSE